MGSYSETIEFDHCECDDPVPDPIRYELPDGSAVELEGCDNCGGLMDWDRSASLPDRDYSTPPSWGQNRQIQFAGARLRMALKSRDTDG